MQRTPIHFSVRSLFSVSEKSMTTLGSFCWACPARVFAVAHGPFGFIGLASEGKISDLGCVFEHN